MQYQLKDDPKTKVQAVQFNGDNAGEIKEFCPFCAEYDLSKHAVVTSYKIKPHLILEDQWPAIWEDELPGVDDYAVFPDSWVVKLGPAKYKVFRDKQFRDIYQLDTTILAIETGEKIRHILEDFLNKLQKENNND
jgi:hypothetical protein